MLRTKDLNFTLSMSAASIISLSKSCVHSENSRLTPERKTRNILPLLSYVYSCQCFIKENRGQPRPPSVCDLLHSRCIFAVLFLLRLLSCLLCSIAQLISSVSVKIERLPSLFFTVFQTSHCCLAYGITQRGKTLRLLRQLCFLWERLISTILCLLKTDFHFSNSFCPLHAWILQGQWKNRRSIQGRPEAQKMSIYPIHCKIDRHDYHLRFEEG